MPKARKVKEPKAPKERTIYIHKIFVPRGYQANDALKLAQETLGKKKITMKEYPAGFHFINIPMDKLDPDSLRSKKYPNNGITIFFAHKKKKE